MDDVRTALMRLSAERGESLSELSRMLRRNVSYLHQFVHKGSPRRLADRDRALLAAHCGVTEAMFGGPTPTIDTAPIPYLSVRAAAGVGLAARDERIVRHEPFALAHLRDAGVSPADASLVAAAGDSMAPTILDGDRLLVDRGDRRLSRAPRILVFRRDGDLSVTRLGRDGGAVSIVSDNPAYPPMRAPIGEIEVVGRVALLLRRPD